MLPTVTLGVTKWMNKVNNRCRCVSSSYLILTEILAVNDCHTRAGFHCRKTWSLWLWPTVGATNPWSKQQINLRLNVGWNSYSVCVSRTHTVLYREYYFSLPSFRRVVVCLWVICLLRFMPTPLHTFVFMYWNIQCQDRLPMCFEF